MSSDSTPVSSPDRLRFDQPAPGPGTPACARCQAPITAAYYEVNGHVVCSGCKTALEGAPAGSGASRMLRATAFGLGGAVLGAGIYYAILAATGYEIGLVAILVGWLVGRAVQKGSNGAGGWAYQTLAVGLTYLAIVSTYVPDSVTVRPVAATVDSSAHRMTVGRFALGVVALVAIAAVAPFLAGFENILGLVIIGFALFQAWKMNRRVPLAISGPYAVGRAAGTGGGE
jgi:hypothetical protein